MYKCKVCDKEFNNSQSYNGHCASHKPRRKREKKYFTQLNIDFKIYECKYCLLRFDNGFKLGGHISSCKFNPSSETKKIKIGNLSRNKKLSKEHKLKISVSRKKYLDENPGQIPYLLNHSSKESYLEKLLRERLEKEKLMGWVQEYPLLRYSLDFAFIDQKIDIEVDGGTHNLENIKEKDIERDSRLISLGWRVLRFSDFEIKNEMNKVIEKIKIGLYP